jgi:hypothetical protein
MKKAQKTQIKKFLTQELKKKVLPFLKLNKVSPIVEKIYQKTIEVLPKLIKPEESMEDSPELKQVLVETNTNTSPKKPNFAKIETNYSVLLPKNEEKQLLSVFKIGTLTNKIKTDKFNNNLLSIPAYKSGKIGVKSDFSNSLVPTRKNIEQIKAKLEPNATTAGGNEPPKIVFLNTDKPGKKEAALVGEAGKEIIDQDTGSVIPVEMMQRLKQQEPKQKESGLKILATDGLNQQSSVLLARHDKMSLINMVQSGQLQNKPSINETGAIQIETPAHFLGVVTGAAKVAKVAKAGMKAAGGIAKGLGGLAKTGLKAAKAAMREGTEVVKEEVEKQVGKVQGLMSSVSGSSGASVKAATKEESKDLGAELEKQKQSSAQFSAMQQSSGGLQRKEATDDIGEDAQSTIESQKPESGSGVGSVVGGALQGIGSAIGGVASGLGAGLGAAAMMSPGFALMQSLFGASQKKDDQDKKANVVLQTGGSTVNVTNIAYQYDIYKKTAEDSFMLPNYRREYG